MVVACDSHRPVQPLESNDPVETDGEQTVMGSKRALLVVSDASFS